jgi:transposase-like protein
LDGQKEMLGLRVERNGGAKFWAGIMDGLKNRRVKDMLLAAADGLTGFPGPPLRYFPKQKSNRVWPAWPATR